MNSIIRFIKSIIDKIKLKIEEIKFKSKRAWEFGEEFGMVNRRVSSKDERVEMKNKINKEWEDYLRLKEYKTKQNKV